MSKSLLTLALMLFAISSSANAADLLPQWADRAGDAVLELQIPQQLKTEMPENAPTYLLLNLDPNWSTDWRQAAFDLKSLVVTLKTTGPNVQVGIQATEAQLNAMMPFDMAPYLDGYLYTDAPYIPEADTTGRLWLAAGAVPDETPLTTLLDASSLGVAVVLFDGVAIDDQHQAFLKTIAATDTGGLDVQPSITNFNPNNATFFFDPAEGNYHLALYAAKGEASYLSFSLAEGIEVTALYPKNNADFEAKQFGERTELNLQGSSAYYFFQLKPAERLARAERVVVGGRKSVDPYELVVKNQVFKDAQGQNFQSLQVDEELNYRYQVPGGIGVDITYYDTIFDRKDMPLERVRNKIYIGGAKWPYKEQPKLPLLQPEKVRRIPLEVDLDKTYAYTYRGEDTVRGRKAWRVGFEPTDQEGNYYTGTVWIDQENGAHLKLRVVQAELEAPVIANDVTATFDWVEDGGVRYWTQVRETGLQVLSIAGERVTLQITAVRENHRFNRDDTEKTLGNIYISDAIILRDTDEGLRYLAKKQNERVVEANNLTRARAIPAGILREDDEIVPLIGYNFTDLNWLGRGYQANFLLAGAINDVVITNPNFLGRNWSLTGEVFVSALYFGDSTFEGDTEIETYEVENLSQSLNITLGIPLNGFWKLDLNYGARFRNYQGGDNFNKNEAGEDLLDDLYVLPSDHIEHIGRVGLEFSWKRFTSELQYETATRSEWESFGLPSNPEPLFDSYRRLEFDATVSKKLKGLSTVGFDIGYRKGWDLDRFSRFDFGFFGNNVSGFAGSGVEADEAYLFELEYEFGVTDFFSLELQVDGAQALINDIENVVTPGLVLDEVNFYGAGIATNFIGPYKTVIRLNFGYGIDSDLDGEAGNVTGQLLILKLF